LAKQAAPGQDSCIPGINRLSGPVAGEVILPTVTDPLTRTDDVLVYWRLTERDDPLTIIEAVVPARFCPKLTGI